MPISRRSSAGRISGRSFVTRRTASTQPLRAGGFRCALHESKLRGNGGRVKPNVHRVTQEVRLAE